jgi:hypothetical protein
MPDIVLIPNRVPESRKRPEPLDTPHNSQILAHDLPTEEISKMLGEYVPLKKDLESP